MSNTVLPSNELRKLLEKATIQYMKNIEEAEGYLAGRGIPLAVARTAGLGVVDRTIPEYRNRAGRLAIPYFTDAGPVNMAFRCLQSHDCKVIEDHGKYLRATDSNVNLYNVQAYGGGHDWICITEGEFDTLSCKAMGIPAIAVPGAKNWKDHWDLVFQDFATIHVLADGDEAGKKFGDKVWKLLGKDRVQRHNMPSGEDVNSMLVKQGYPYFQKILGL